MPFINFLWLTAFLVAAKPQPAMKAKTIKVMGKVINAVNRVNTIQYKVKSLERMRDGKMSTSVVKIKSATNPFKVYYYVLKPDKGVEILYKAGDKKAILHPNGFPYFNLRLDPNGYLMRKGQHHSISDNGWQGIAKRLQLYLDDLSHDDHLRLSVNNIQYQGTDCLQINIIKNNFGFKAYKAREGENILLIASHYHLNAYMVLCKNASISWYNDISAGNDIELPNGYCRQFSLIVDKNTFLPLQLECKDDKGIFEKYTFTLLKINPVFKPGEFSTNWKAYNF